MRSSVCAGFFTGRDPFAYGSADIDNSTSFKDKMQTQLDRFITSTAQLISPHFESPFSINMAFSATGLSALGVPNDLGDPAFSGGQFADANSLVSALGQNRCETNAAPGRPGNGQLGRGVQGKQHQRCLPHRQVSVSYCAKATPTDKVSVTLGPGSMMPGANSPNFLAQISPSFTS